VGCTLTGRTWFENACPRLCRVGRIADSSIDGVFEAAPADGVVFRAATGLDANAITQLQAQVRRRMLPVFVRRRLLPCDDAQAMAQWAPGGGFSVDGSVRIAAADRAGRERLLRYCARPRFALAVMRAADMYSVSVMVTGPRCSSVFHVTASSTRTRCKR